MKNIIVPLVIGLVIGAAGVYFLAPDKDSLGAFPGPEILEEVRLRDGLVVGGPVTATTTVFGVAENMTKAQLCDSSIIKLNQATKKEAMAYTTVASSTAAQCVPNAGDSKSVFLWNNSATAATTTTVTAGTGIVLTEHDGGDVIIPGGEWAKLTTRNLGGRTIMIEVDSVRDAD